jgi:hypothetical protein
MFFSFYVVTEYTLRGNANVAVLSIRSHKENAAFHFGGMIQNNLRDEMLCVPIGGSI